MISAVKFNFILIKYKDKVTFINLPSWIQFINDIENTMLVICGNKLDKEDER